MWDGRVPSAALALGFWVIHRRSAAEAKEKQKSRNKVAERWGGGGGAWLRILEVSLLLFALQVKSCLFCCISWTWKQTELCSQPRNTWWPSLQSTFPLDCTFVRTTVFSIGDSLSLCSPQCSFCSKHVSTKKSLTHRVGVREESEAGKHFLSQNAWTALLPLHPKPGEASRVLPCPTDGCPPECFHYTLPPAQQARDCHVPTADAAGSCLQESVACKHRVVMEGAGLPSR